MQRRLNPKGRFSLKTLLVAITCLCCYTAGHLNGYRLRKAQPETDSSQTYPVVYPVSLSAEIRNDATATSETINDVVDRVKTGVMPTVWNDTDKQFQVAPFAANQSLIVKDDQPTHDAVGAFLTQARDIRMACE